MPWATRPPTCRAWATTCDRKTSRYRAESLRTTSLPSSGVKSESVIVIGAHIDTVAVSPGGNDNASGVAVVLELARDLRDADIVATVQFVVFGAEEMTDSNADHHHYGSRQFVAGPDRR